jgi:AcrR family transcriptional regulator
VTKNIRDRRVQKTRKLLQDALVGLIEEKGYESITVQEILDRANVGRSTFYAHFQYKDQLLYSCFDDIHELFEQLNKRVSEARKNSEDINHVDITLSLFRFAGRNHRFFKALLGKRRNGVFNQYFYDYLFAHMHEHLKLPLASEKRSLQSEIMAHYLASAFMGILVWWVDNDLPCTAEEIDMYFNRLVMPGFRNVLGLNYETS